MKKLALVSLAVVIALGTGMLTTAHKPVKTGSNMASSMPSAVMDSPIGSQARFAYLASQHSNYCSLDRAKVMGYSNDVHMQGACCNPMDMDKYQKQVSYLKQYSDIMQIPKDPYDIPVSLAKQLYSYENGIKLTGADKTTYDQAMQMTDDKGPCCCQCWRWYMTEGLDKYLITQHRMTVQQIADVTEKTNGCGGPMEHNKETV